MYLPYLKYWLTPGSLASLKGGPATDYFYVLAPFNHIVTQFFQNNYYYYYFSIHPMAPLEVEFMPRRLQKTILAVIVSFFKRPVIVSFFQTSCYCFIFKRPVVVSFFLSSVIVFHFCNRHRYCFIFSIVPFLFNFLQSSRFYSLASFV
jgi:hypothetical protein